MEEMHFNWAAYAVAVVAQMIVGYIWYNPAVMGKMWAQTNGIDEKDMQPKNMGMAVGLSVVLTLLFTMWLMINVTGPGQDTAPDGHSYHTFMHGFAHAVILSIMIMIPVYGMPAIYERRGMKWFLIHVGHWFLRMVVGAGILSAWR
jgi:hypothetical protein